jgi:hypothetical protein
MSRDFYLEEHDSARWAAKAPSTQETKRGYAASDGD